MLVLEETFNKNMQKLPTSPKMCLHYLGKFAVTG